MSGRIYLISVAATLTGMHPQTLRSYDRLGLVSPSRTVGLDRRYSEEDITMLLHVRQLAREGLNTAGILKVLQLEKENQQLRETLQKLKSK